MKVLFFFTIDFRFHLVEIAYLIITDIVVLFQGFWSLHFPAWHQMREELAAGTVGKLKMVIVNFGQDIISQGVSRLTDRYNS